MNTKNIFKIAISLLVVILFLNSCSQENDNFAQEDLAQNKFQIKSLNTKENPIYTENYKVNSETTSIDLENNILNLEIPVPLNDYSFLKAYNISTNEKAAILYVITRNSTENVSKLPINYTIEASFDYTQLNISNTLIEKNGLNIYVMNNSRLLSNDYVQCFKESKINNNSQINCNFVLTKSDGDGPVITAKDGSIIITDL